LFIITCNYIFAIFVVEKFSLFLSEKFIEKYLSNRHQVNIALE